MTVCNEELQPERSSTEIVHSLFGPSVGLCWGDFSCSHHRQRGRLYAASNAICFFSNLFGFERKICLSLDRITEIKAYRSTSVSISSEEEEYIFKSFADRQLVVALLLQLLQKTRPEDTSLLPQEQSFSEYNQYGDQNSSILETSLELATAEQSPDVSIVVDSEVLPSPIKEEDDEGDTSSEAESVQSETEIPEDPEEAWEAAKLANDPPYNETAVDELVLPCTLDEFFALFLADNAPHSIDDYQESVIGDSELKVSEWAANDGTTLTRTIHFVHPLHLSVGPTSALAERQQTFRRYATYGFCLETATYVTGVIASDNFYVDDKWIVEPNGETSVTLTVKHQVRFVKRTMLKRMILTSTNAEVEKWFEGYCKMLLESLEKKGTARAMIAQPAPVEKEVPPQIPPAAFVLLWICTMAGFVLVLLQLMALNSKLTSLEEELARLCKENMVAFARLEEAIARME